MAAALAYPDRCAGILCVGSTAQVVMEIGGRTAMPMAPRRVPAFYLVGETDYNRDEVEKVYRIGRQEGRQVALRYHPGGHTWGRPQDREAGILWLARRTGR